MFRRERLMLTNWQEPMQLLHPYFSLAPAPKSSTDWRFPVWIVCLGGDPRHTGRGVGWWTREGETVLEAVRILSLTGSLWLMWYIEKTGESHGVCFLLKLLHHKFGNSRQYHERFHDHALAFCELSASSAGWGTWKGERNLYSQYVSV